MELRQLLLTTGTHKTNTEVNLQMSDDQAQGVNVNTVGVLLVAFARNSLVYILP